MATSQSTTLLKQEANDHLREIRRRKDVDCSDGEPTENMRDLDSALAILSNQLYQKETHFILELIQNADDNAFENDVVPTLSFHLVASKNSWQMLILCNEIGFEKDNVESLCRIGHSTKKNKDRTTGYIGEKGIGFKSVFKVADVVHVSSKAYSFRLDRRNMLGMITPIIETFPPANLMEVLDDHTRQNQTQILLELLSEAEFSSISKELQNLKPQILIFLRKIRRISIRTPSQNDHFKIQTVVEDQDFDGGETATLTKTTFSEYTKIEEKYLIVRRLYSELADDERRRNVKATELVLAFPVEKWRPVVQAQDTYAYLPINDYGFNYLIQADFLLVANRESIEYTEWNKNLRLGLYRTFVWTAVARFNQVQPRSPEIQSLRYTWPLFLKDRGGADTFWSTLKTWILDRLSSEDVLESRLNGKLTQPKCLFHIPKIFRLNGQPLVEEKGSESQHLSFLYDSEMINILPELKKMKVKVMDFSQFYRELQDAIKKVGHSFLTNQSEEWHSTVANLFNRHSSKYQAKNIPLIPVSDGRWVKPSHSNLLIEGESADVKIPAELDICLVDHKACRDLNRMKFFMSVGIKRCDQAEICQIIVNSYTPFRARSLNSSVQDLLYLFQTPQTVYNGSMEKLQVLGAGKFRSGFKYASKVYIDYSGKDSVVSKYAEHPESPMPILNSAYLEAASSLGKEVEFVGWGCSRLKMSHLPRLADERQSPSPDFNFLKNHAMEDLLLLLRNNWDHYTSDFEVHNGNATGLKKAILEMQVPCINGPPRHLDQTVLPRESLKLAGPDLVFVNIPEPNNNRWLKFSAFGVLTKLSTDFYLRQLKALAFLPVTDRTSTTTVEAIYAGLGTFKGSMAVREAFAESRLVYLPNFKKWVFLSECVWSAPKQLESTYNISSVYPSHNLLFRSCLQLEDAKLDHVVKELELVTDSTSFHILRQLLLLLNNYLSPKDSQICLSSLKGKKIIPVTSPSGEERMDFNKDEWYLADRQSLLDRFNGQIPLISFDVKTVRKLRPLIDAMDLSDCLLSTAVEQKLEIVGLKIEDKERTDDLRNRARFFVNLIPMETPKTKSQLLTRLLNLKVWGVRAVTMTQEVYSVKVTEETSHILFDDADSSKIEIYISIKGFQKPMVDFQLSKEFIRYCGITDDNSQKLVLPIIQYPQEEIKKLLEDYGLDEPMDHDEEPIELLDSVSVKENDESDSLHRASPALKLVSGGQSSDTSTLDEEWSSRVSKQSSWKDKVPTLDQSIALVREAAALSSTAPTLIGFPSRRRTDARESLDQDNVEHSIVGDMSGFVGKMVDEARQSISSKTEDAATASLSAFDFANFHTEFSESFSPNSHSQHRRTSATQNHFIPQYSRSPRGARMEPDPESTMFGIQMQTIGLLGETFVNEWLSNHLTNDWDPTCHWTSRNRNATYPQSPFMDSEKDYADFTYPDNNGGELTKLLANFLRHDVDKWSSNPPTYHLEVKSTSEGCSEPFYMSNNQLNKAREYTIPNDISIIPKDVYAIIRVYSLEAETTPGFTVYVDPWAMYLAGSLNFLARENYSVTPNTGGN